VCCGVAHIHEQGIIHRDLKSQNIFIDGEGHYKIGDFGIGRVLSKQTDFVSTFSHGTPLCMSPELLENKPYNTKTDVWALGVILYEMTTLQYPFMGQTLYELLYKIVHGPYEPVTAHHGYSKHLIKLIDGLLVKDFHRRPTVQHILEYMETIGKVRKKDHARARRELERKDDSSSARGDERYRLPSRESVASSSVPSSVLLMEGKIEDDPVLVFDTPRSDMESFWAEVERRCEQPKQSGLDISPRHEETKDDLVCLPHHREQGSEVVRDTLVMGRHVSESDVSSSAGTHGHGGEVEVVRVFHKESKTKREEETPSSQPPLPPIAEDHWEEDHWKEDQPPLPPVRTVSSSSEKVSVSSATKQKECIISGGVEDERKEARGGHIAERDKRYVHRLQERRAKLRSQESIPSCDSSHGKDDRKRIGVAHSIIPKREKRVPDASVCSSTDESGRPPPASVASSSSNGNGLVPPPSRGFAGFVMGIGQAEAESVEESRRPSTASSGMSSSRESMKDALFGRRVLEAEDSSSSARRMLERQRREKPDGEIVDQFGAGAELSMLRRDVVCFRSHLFGFKMCGALFNHIIAFPFVLS
jgi:serine/threonine protein kinase